MNIIWVSDFDLRGSGYFNISSMFCQKLSELGHEVVALGLGYKGEEHQFDFGIVPAKTFQEVAAMFMTIKKIWQVDAFIVALDIPFQEQIYKIVSGYAEQIKRFAPFSDLAFIGIMPIEAPPLVTSWAIFLNNLDAQFIMTKFGVEEFQKRYISTAEYIEIPIDTEAWRPATQEEKSKLREAFGISEETFVILTVADNQERKFLSRSFEIYSEFLKTIPDSTYLLVTREHLDVGWKLRDLANDLEIPGDKLMIFERGMSFKELWTLYAIADVFLLTSKAEGLGVPVLESMSMRLPVVATDCCAMREHLSENRGWLIETDYDIIDPFGNEFRYYANIGDGVKKLLEVYEFSKESEFIFILDKAQEYIASRSVDKSVNQLVEKIKEINNVEKTQKQTI